MPDGDGELFGCRRVIDVLAAGDGEHQDVGVFILDELREAGSLLDGLGWGCEMVVLRDRRRGSEKWFEVPCPCIRPWA